MKMTFDWFKMLQNGRSEPLKRLYQSPADPLLKRDIRRLTRMVDELVAEQLDRVVPPFAKIEHAHGLWLRIRSYQQLWLSLSGRLRKDLQRVALKNLSELRPQGVQLQALLLTRLSREQGAPEDWISMMRRKGSSLMPWRAAVSLAVASNPDFDAAWVQRFELEMMLIKAAGDTGLTHAARGLRSQDQESRERAVGNLLDIFQRLDSEFETIFRKTASRFIDPDLIAHRLDVGVDTISQTAEVARSRSPGLASLRFDHTNGSGMVRRWHDRYAAPPDQQPFSKPGVLKTTLQHLESMHPKIRAAAEAVIRKGWVLQPDGRGGGFTAPVLYNRSGKPDFGPLVHAPFDGDLQSARTLSHELGHAAHGELSKHCGPLMHDAGWAVSEFMALTCERLLLEAHPDALIAQDFHMLVHQPAIAEFEQRLGTSSQSEPLDSIWISAMGDLYGDGVSLTGYAPFWRRHTATISNAGYPFAYTLGWALARHVAKRIIENDAAVKAELLDIAKAGAALGFEEVARRFGAEDIPHLLEEAFDDAENRLKQGHA